MLDELKTPFVIIYICYLLTIVICNLDKLVE